MGQIEPHRGERPPQPITVWGSIAAPRVADPGPSKRFLELDGYRGIAALGIVVFHVYQYCNVQHYLYGGTPGYTILNSLDALVPLFFVISAFVLFEPIARDLLDGRTPVSARSLLQRRALRLLPVYVVAVAVVWFLRQRSLPGDWRDLVEHLTFTQVFDGKRIFYTIGPAWSLSVAMYFYVVLAVMVAGLAYAGRRVTARNHRIAMSAGAIAVLGAVTVLWTAWSFGVRHRATDGSFTTWFGPLANADVFAVGMAVALVVAAFRRPSPLNRIGTISLRVAAGALLFVAFDTRQIDSWSAAYFATTCSVAFGALVASATLGTGADLWSRALAWRPLRSLGAISLSIYLWHEPIMLLLGGPRGLVTKSPGSFVGDTAVVLSASILVGSVSYFVIERPTARLARNLAGNMRGRRAPALGRRRPAHPAVPSGQRR